MIERSCEIVQTPTGDLAALMPLPDLRERHWVAVAEGPGVLHARGRIHTQTKSWRIASQPWVEQWKPIGMRNVLLIQPDQDYDLGGGD